MTSMNITTSSRTSLSTLDTVVSLLIKDKQIRYFFYAGKQRTKKEAEQNTNRHNPGGHERKIVTKLMNAEKNSNNKIKS